MQKLNEKYLESRNRGLNNLPDNYHRLQDYRDTGIQGYRYTGIQGYRDTGIQGYRDTGIQGYRYTGL